MAERPDLIADVEIFWLEARHPDDQDELDSLVVQLWMLRMIRRDLAELIEMAPNIIANFRRCDKATQDIVKRAFAL